MCVWNCGGNISYAGDGTQWAFGRCESSSTRGDDAPTLHPSIHLLFFMPAPRAKVIVMELFSRHSFTGSTFENDIHAILRVVPGLSSIFSTAFSLRVPHLSHTLSPLLSPHDKCRCIFLWSPCSCTSSAILRYDWCNLKTAIYLFILRYHTNAHCDR